MVRETGFYDLFDVQPDADVSQITLSYRKLAKKFHPDKNPENGDKFKEISSAYDILSGKFRHFWQISPIQKLIFVCRS